MRRAAQVDANQAEIVAALRRAGATVEQLHMVGAGCPDLLVGFRRQNFLLELKVPKAQRPRCRGRRSQLNARQGLWHGGWRGQVAVVTSAAEAIAAIGIRLVEDPEEHAARQLLNDRGIPGSVDDEVVMARGPA